MKNVPRTPASCISASTRSVLRTTRLSSPGQVERSTVSSNTLAWK
jgi:hypothetical protein